SFAAGVDAARALSQSGLFPTNCRLLDPSEALTSAGVTRGSGARVLGFESADHPVETAMARACELVADHGGTLPEGMQHTTATTGDAAGAGRNTFVRAPSPRDGLVQLGVAVETFQTAVTWDRFAEFHDV